MYGSNRNLAINTVVVHECLLIPKWTQRTKTRNPKFCHTTTTKMPITSPALVPRPPIIPLILSRTPQVNPTPLPKLNRYPERMDTRRDLQRELETRE
ncbi:hypothetical protein BDR06DRAFT_696519 [Suillus hirtellus]|nr:hypothetical protein BDR06DRAFT_696519 [Suillus hirtellus]